MTHIGLMHYDELSSAEHPEAAAMWELGLSVVYLSNSAGPYLHILEKPRSHVILYNYGDEITLTIAGRRIPLSEGQTLLLDGRFPRTFEQPAGKTHRRIGFHLDLQAAVPSPLLAAMPAGEPCLLRKAQDALGMLHLTELLTAEANAPNTQFRRREMMEHVSGAIALMLMRDFGPAERAGGDPAVRERIEALWQKVAGDLAHAWTVEELSRQAGMSKATFYRFCLNLYGCAPMQKVLALRMAQAKRLLLSTRLPLPAIAARLGYSTAYAFSAAFSREVSQSPIRYRKSCLLFTS